MQMSNVNAKQATSAHLSLSISIYFTHSMHAKPFGPAFLTVATCCLLLLSTYHYHQLLVLPTNS